MLTLFNLKGSIALFLEKEKGVIQKICGLHILGSHFKLTEGSNCWRSLGKDLALKLRTNS